MTIAERLREVETRVTRAARKADRDPASVRVVVVSKTFPVAAVLEAYRAGARIFGENRAQEFAEKVVEAGEDIEWHFVGKLQTNKVRLVANRASLIHSVDSLKLAEAIGKRAGDRPQDVLIEVNVSGEGAKQGVAPGDAIDLSVAVHATPGVSVRGLMTIPPLPDVPESSRPFYRQLAGLGEDLRKQIPDAHELSMGMTRDFEVAVEEGATLVRVGEAVFGPRDA